MTVTGPTVHIRSVAVLPAGVEPGDLDAADFGITVDWMGPFEGKSGGGWAVRCRHGASELSRTGLWTFCVPRFRRWQHRWEHYDDALAAAVAAIDTVTINGGTRAQWAARRAAMEAAQ